MNKNEWKKWTGVVGRMLAFALVFATSAWAAQNQTTKDKAGSMQKTAGQQANKKQSAVAKEKPSRDGSHEGVKVHGHWTIEVRNADGAVVAHREFENSLSTGASNGNIMLASYLSRGSSVGAWTVELSGNSSANPPCGTAIASSASICFIQEPLIPAGGSNVFNTLKVTGPQSTPATNDLILSGTAVAIVAGQIASVATANTLCANTTPPSTPCTGSSSAATPNGFLTIATLSSPISVQAGQTIAVTVDINFS